MHEGKSPTFLASQHLRGSFPKRRTNDPFEDALATDSGTRWKKAPHHMLGTGAGTNPAWFCKGKTRVRPKLTKLNLGTLVTLKAMKVIQCSQSAQRSDLPLLPRCRHRCPSTGSHSDLLPGRVAESLSCARTYGHPRLGNVRALTQGKEVVEMKHSLLFVALPMFTRRAFLAVPLFQEGDAAGELISL